MIQLRISWWVVCTGCSGSERTSAERAGQQQCKAGSRKLIHTFLLDALKTLCSIQRKKWNVIEEGRCILHNNSFDDWRFVDDVPTPEENNKEWELLEKFLAKAQGTREEGLE